MTKLVATAALIFAAACSTAETTASSCRNIPDGGCPLAHGVACDDPACEAAYGCYAGAWKLDRVCGPRDASAEAGPTSDAGPRDAQVDVPGANGGPGCGLLEPPDCPAGAALLCPQGCCGCEDLFVCSGGGWNHWGLCVDGSAQQN